jgi:hypothetical protein
MCLPQRCVAMFAAWKTLLSLLLRNRHVYRSAAYKLLEQIRYNIINEYNVKISGSKINIVSKGKEPIRGEVMLDNERHERVRNSCP